MSSRHTPTLDSAIRLHSFRREVADTALDFVQRFVKP
jgi:hypothetical protein